MKFVLFIFDDMVEFLGPEFLGPIFPEIVNQICSYASSKFSAIRQAAVYGIGMIAQHGGTSFSTSSLQCLQSLKTAISYPMDNATKEKKSKQMQYNHARDNAIAALGKIVKYQESAIDAVSIIPTWISLLPLNNDLEEAKIQNEYLAAMLMKRPMLVMGQNHEGLEHLVTILGAISSKKQSSPETLDALSVVISEISGNADINSKFQEICQAKLSEEQRSRLSDLYSKCNEEVRQQVAQRMQAQ